MTPHEREKYRFEDMQISMTRRAKMAEIVRQAADETHIPAREIMGNRRFADVARARHIAVTRCYRDLGYSSPVVAKFFGYADHTTVLHAAARIEAMEELR